MWYSFLIFAYGISWVIVYLSFIRNGWKEKIYCMPFFCIINEILWESIYFSTTAKLDLSVQTLFDALWALCALIFLYQFIRYGKNTFPKPLQHRRILYICLSVPMAIAIQLSLYKMWDYPNNMIYSSYIHTVTISFFLLIMLWVRGSKGYDLRIAIFKIIGNVSAIILSSNLYMGKNVDIAVLYIGSALVMTDILFLISLIQQRKESRQVEK